MSPMVTLFSRLDASAGQPFILSLEVVLMSLMLAFVLGQLIAWTYAWTHSGLSYSRSFVQMLVVVPIVVSLVMLTIGNNMITAFGLIGALALVRFRNVLKDTRDTIFIFMSLVVGMAAGSQRYFVAIIGTLFILAVLFYVHVTDFGSRGYYDGYLRFSAPSDGPGAATWPQVMRRFCRRAHRVSQRHSAGRQQIDCTYQVRLRDRRVVADLVAAMEAIDGVSNVSMILQEEMAEV